MSSLLLGVVFLVVIFVVMRRIWDHYRMALVKGKRLPPGSMGWPYVGETFQLYSQNPNVFFAAKQKRYGDVFKTHLLGCPCVMIASPEAAKFILVNKADLFRPTFPASKQCMLGSQALFFHEGEYHARIRRLVQNSLSPNSIKNMVSLIETVVLEALETWEGNTINTFQEMKRHAFNVGILSIFGREEVFDMEDLKRSYDVVERGYNSMALNLPGTLFHKALKARKHLSQILIKVIAERRTKKIACNDLLGALMDSRDEISSEPLTDEQIGDNIIGVIFAAQHTTASVLTWMIKYLCDNPPLLEAVKAEQEAIAGVHCGRNKPLTWTDTRRMRLTSRVIQETLRIATIISFTFREAVEDVEYKGFMIPKGWKVMPLFRNIHHNSELFSDPHKFDPSRFEMPPKPNTFLAFGNGTHACPGSELAKLEMLVLIHHLTTKYRWHRINAQNGIEYGPFPVPKEGLPLKVTRRA